jgi:hypothetical protein
MLQDQCALMEDVILITESRRGEDSRWGVEFGKNSYVALYLLNK